MTGVALRQVPATASVLSASVPFSPPFRDPLRPRPTGFYPSAGVSLVTAFDLFQLDLSRGFRDGRWIFSFDVSRAFWSVL